MVFTISTKVTSKIDTSYYLHHKKHLWNAIAIAYALGGYGSAIALILSNFWFNALGVVLLAHSLVISAYLSHEFMHGTIFAERKWNAVGGNIMLWLNGGCYARFKDLTQDHIAHHINRVDFASFDLQSWMHQLPVPIRRVTLALEWLHFPIVSFIFQWRSILAPFWEPRRHDEQKRLITILSIRSLLLIALALLSLKAVALYFLSYIGMITVLRFVDAFQHTYEAIPVGSPLPKRDYTYEQTNTFSNVISQRYWWLNLLLLNFGYHNAHHELMKCPWHSLHELDREVFTGEEVHYITLPELLGNYHRFRITRLFSDQGTAIDSQGNLQLETFYGAIGVSFLVKF
ncbi:fatty acid desaturase [Gloeocapsopsis crepidinum LEGE 06123]|uniref:Fatty acid desaturase n=1 Tax=Gloeocapsopsis crepidinum LEGE 06123 TaxID=588587 RepID=A0ABR9UMJ8_9CHRO|nr:fatty acid desaturase [Gloeocapsopsis crepidinum]MBE9189268.1 fatty acid desaturase [Gloeocapsopsis crepidinum LEGE 06123]